MFFASCPNPLARIVCACSMRPSVIHVFFFSASLLFLLHVCYVFWVNVSMHTQMACLFNACWCVWNVAVSRCAGAVNERDECAGPCGMGRGKWQRFEVVVAECAAVLADFSDGMSCIFVIGVCEGLVLRVQFCGYAQKWCVRFRVIL